MTPREPATTPPPGFVLHKKRLRFLGLTVEDCIRAFFGGNAIMSIVVLALITYFLFREGAGFFGQNRQNIEVYRQAGLEYVDYLRQQTDDHTALTRYLSDVRLRALNHLAEEKKLSFEDASTALAPFDEFAGKFSDAVEPLRGLVSDLTEQATAIKTKFIVNGDKREERRQLLAEGKAAEAAAVQIETVDFAVELKPLLESLPAFKDGEPRILAQTAAVTAAAPEMPTPELEARMVRFKELTATYLGGLPTVERNLETWDYTRPVPITQAFTAYLFGRQWLTASFWQDWYGVLPLFVGSLMVSFVALALAVPLGVGAAIYVNQIASRPGAAVHQAVHRVHLGVPLGRARVLRHRGARPGAAGAVAVTWLSWVPGFPYSERLNILTAGCLLALIAVPTIFTLAEDALNNVPARFKEASFALGASRLQTIVKDHRAGVALGHHFGGAARPGPRDRRDDGGAALRGQPHRDSGFHRRARGHHQPVHTMTGIIAQEMGEVVRGSIHYRALFVVGLVLFVLSLGSTTSRRHRAGIGSRSVEP
jgi:phosphate transport system permease protein